MFRSVHRVHAQKWNTPAASSDFSSAARCRRLFFNLISNNYPINLFNYSLI